MLSETAFAHWRHCGGLTWIDFVSIRGGIRHSSTFPLQFRCSVAAKSSSTFTADTATLMLLYAQSYAHWCQLWACILPFGICDIYFCLLDCGSGVHCFWV